MAAPSGQPMPQSLQTLYGCMYKIGIRGDGSCPKLQEHAHCRNCPVYKEGALAALGRELTDNYFEGWGEDYSERPASAGLETHSAVIFRIGAEWFALPAEIFDEATELRTIHSLPHRRNGIVLGLVNVRGALVICVSLARMLGLEETAPLRSVPGNIGQRRLLVLRHESGRVAAPVDEVQGTHRYDPHKLKAVPASIAKAAANYTTGLLPWRDAAVGCLDHQMIIQTVNRNAA